MIINNKIKEAEFTINKNLIIRYKKGCGFYGLKKIGGDLWVAYTNTFCMNSLALGFKENYGFGFKDMKPFFFKSFDEALKTSDEVNELEYWEYNKSTHEKILDATLRKGRFEQIIEDFVDTKGEILNKINSIYERT